MIANVSHGKLAIIRDEIMIGAVTIRNGDDISTCLRPAGRFGTVSKIFDKLSDLAGIHIKFVRKSSNCHLVEVNTSTSIVVDECARIGTTRREGILGLSWARCCLLLCLLVLLL